MKAFSRRQPAAVKARRVWSRVRLVIFHTFRKIYSHLVQAFRTFYERFNLILDSVYIEPTILPFRERQKKNGKKIYSTCFRMNAVCVISSINSISDTKGVIKSVPIKKMNE